MSDKGFYMKTNRFVQLSSMLLLSGFMIPSFAGHLALPNPAHTDPFAQTLTLTDAIALALRDSPDIVNAELSRVSDKFSLQSAYAQFHPKFTFGSSLDYTKGGQATYGVTPGFSLETPIGTSITADYSSNLEQGPGTVSFNISQPLLSGAGANIVQAGLKDAIDAAKSAQLTYQSDIANAIVSVITNYRQLIQDDNSLRQQRHSLHETYLTLQHDKLKVKAGKVAPSDVLEQESNYASAKLSFIQQQQSTHQNYQTFLESIGLDPSINIKIDDKLPHFSSYKIPKLSWAIQYGLKHNVSYLQQELAIKSTERALQVKENANEWSLNLTAGATVGNDGANTSLNNTGYYYANGFTPTVGLALNIPIDNSDNENAIVQAKIALQQARVNLRKAKQDLIRNITNEIENLQNQKQQIQLAEQSQKLQQQTVNAAEIRYQYGKVSLFELNQQRDSLLSAQLSMISSKISYANAITQLNNTLNLINKHWGIKLKD